MMGFVLIHLAPILFMLHRHSTLTSIILTAISAIQSKHFQAFILHWRLIFLVARWLPLRVLVVPQPHHTKTVFQSHVSMTLRPLLLQWLTLRRRRAIRVPPRLRRLHTTNPRLPHLKSSCFVFLCEWTRYKPICRLIRTSRTITRLTYPYPAYIQQVKSPTLYGLSTKPLAWSIRPCPNPPLAVE